MRNVKCVIVGDSGVGKKCLLIAYTTNLFHREYNGRLFENFTVKRTVDDNPINLEIWTAVERDYHRLLSVFTTSEADVFLIAFDVTNRVSFRNIKSKWITELQHHAPGVPFILVGTKSDLRSDASTSSQSDQDMVGEHEIQYMVQDIGAVKYCETSALTREGLNNVFEEAVRAAL